MSAIVRQLILMLHWAGFISLIWVISIFTMAFINQPISEVLQILIEGLDPRHSNGLLYLAVFHYPTIWVLTGNRPFFPWQNQKRR